MLQSVRVLTPGPAADVETETEHSQERQGHENTHDRKHDANTIKRLEVIRAPEAFPGPRGQCEAQRDLRHAGQAASA